MRSTQYPGGVFRSIRLLLIVVLLSGLLVTLLHHASAQESEEPSGQLQAQPTDDTVFQRFLEWLPRARPANDTPELTKQYRSHLTSAGASDTEVRRQMGIIGPMLRGRADGWRLIFNNVYASSTPTFVTQPNALLVATVEGRKPGRALDIGMGQGRNSVFLALEGWDVTGFDVSDEGIAAARKNAERAGVKINAIRETDEAFDYGTGRWDLIVFMYEPFPVTSTVYVERLRKSLKTGGLIVLENFAPEETMLDWTATDPGALLVAFKDFRLVYFHDTFAKPDFVTPQEKRHLVRMVVEKRP